MRYPTKWGDVTLRQYYNLLDVLEQDTPSEEAKAFAILSCLTDIPCEDIESKIPVKEVSKALLGIKFIAKEDKAIPKAIIRIGKRRFLFDMVLRDSLASSFIDLSTYAKTEKEAKRNIHNIVAIFAHEINWFGFRKKRTIKSQQEIAEYFKENLTMDYAFGYAGFFLNSWKRLQKGTLTYLEKQKRKMLKELKREADQLL